MGFFGGGGAAPARTLPTVPITSGRVLHLDASVASSLFDATSGGSAVAIGGSVARWEDQSGNGRHATQSTSNNRPVYRKYDDVGGLFFDGSNDDITGSFTSLSSQTICVACRLGYNLTNKRLFTLKRASGGDVSATGYIPLILTSNAGGGTLGSYTTDYRVSTTPKATDISIFAVHTGTELYLRFNGTDTSTFAHTLTGTFTNYSLGGNFGADAFNCLIHEVIVFDSALSSSDRTSIDNYFKDKYRWAW
jgi:hypothetical protein